MPALFKRSAVRFLTFTLVVLSSMFFVLRPIIAQDSSSSTPVDFVGTITAIAQNTVIVDQTIVDISSANMTVSLQPGMTVRVQGVLQGGIVTAQVIETAVSTATPTATPLVTATATPEATGEPGTIIVIEGPVKQININLITIYNFDILVTADHPILKVIKLGDRLKVHGRRGTDGILIATLISNVLNPTSAATVSLNGNVQAINGNIVVINGVNVQFAPNDPALATLKIGDVLNIEGNFQGNGTTIVLVVVNVVIINNVNIIQPDLTSNCKVTKKGHIKCSKKHR